MHQAKCRGCITDAHSGNLNFRRRIRSDAVWFTDDEGTLAADAVLVGTAEEARVWKKAGESIDYLRIVEYVLDEGDRTCPADALFRPYR